MCLCVRVRVRVCVCVRARSLCSDTQNTTTDTHSCIPFAFFLPFITIISYQFFSIFSLTQWDSDSFASKRETNKHLFFILIFQRTVVVDYLAEIFLSSTSRMTILHFSFLKRQEWTRMLYTVGFMFKTKNAIVTMMACRRPAVDIVGNVPIQRHCRTDALHIDKRQDKRQDKRRSIVTHNTRYQAVRHRENVAGQSDSQIH